MSRKQRQLLFTLATFALLIGLQSLATAEDHQKGNIERWCAQRDLANCATDKAQNKTTKQVANPNQPKLPSGSTGPTAPPKPTQGNTHK